MAQPEFTSYRNTDHHSPLWLSCLATSIRRSAWVFALMSAAAQAQSWVSTGATERGELFLDVASIRPHGQFMKAWTRYALKHQATSTGYPVYSYMSSKSLDYYDCKNGSVATKQTIYYADSSGTGPITHGYGFRDAQLDFQDPIPGTIGEWLLNRVCFQRR